MIVEPIPRAFWISFTMRVNSRISRCFHLKRYRLCNERGTQALCMLDTVHRAEIQKGTLDQACSMKDSKLISFPFDILLSHTRYLHFVNQPASVRLLLFLEEEIDRPFSSFWEACKSGSFVLVFFEGFLTCCLRVLGLTPRLLGSWQWCHQKTSSACGLFHLMAC